MKFKKTLSLTIVLSLVMTLALPMSTPAFAADGETEYSIDGDATWTVASFVDAIAALNAADGGGIVKLLGDVTLSATQTINKDITVISGGDYTIWRGSELENQLFIVNTGAALTLGQAAGMGDGNTLTIDGGAIWTGTADGVLGRGTENEGHASQYSLITGSGIINMYDGITLQNNACNTNNGGAANLFPGSVFNMYGGKIRDMYFTGDAGAISVMSGASLTMSGTAQISGCHADGWSGAISNSGTFTMSGTAKISGCSCAGAGGAIGNYGTLEISGGSITDNACASGNHGGGIVMWNGTFNISGDPVISGNAINGTTENIYLRSGTAVTVNGTLAAASAKIGITGQDGLGMAVVGSYDTYQDGNTLPAPFFSDVASLALVSDGSGGLKLGLAPSDPDLGTVTASDIYVGDALSLSELARSDTSVAGTLSWEANAGFDSSTAGDKTATYRFVPTDTSKYNTLTNQSVTVTVLEKLEFDIGDGNITISAGTDDDTLKVNYGAEQVMDNIPGDQEIFIKGSSAVNKVVVNILGQSADITLDDVDIEFTEGDSCAFAINEGTVNLTLSGENILKSSGGNAGLRVTEGQTLTIQGTGSLTATGATNAAGIGGGNSANSGSITINGGIVTATGGSSGAGIGGGWLGSGGTITIKSGIVTATGGSSGAGIGGGLWGSGGTITISNSATVIAVSDGPRSAVDAVGGSLAEGSTAYVLMANFAAGKSSGTSVNAYLNSSGSLKANYTPDVDFQSIAFTVPEAGSYLLFAADIPQQHTGGKNFSVSTGLNLFTSVSPLPYTAAVYKDDETWTGDAPGLKLSTASDALTGAITGTFSEGVYTFASGLDYSLTYYVWDTTNDQYTGQSVSVTGTSTAVNYYTVTLTKGTNIASTTGGGTYLSGSDVTIDAEVSNGYVWKNWTLTSDGSGVTTTKHYTITDISGAQSYTANAKLPYIGDGTYWTDTGNYDTTLYNTLTTPDFSAASVDISTPQELAALARAVDIDGITFSGVTFELTKDIDLDGCLWDPIGLMEGDMLHGAADGGEHPFMGNFDGNGHVISRMDIEGSYICAGLFGVVGNTNMDDLGGELYTISNLTVGGTVEVTDAAAGGIVGAGGNLLLTNCVNNATITVSGAAIAGGGILAFGLGVVVDNCVNGSGADISVATTSADSEMWGVGGIAGIVYLGSIYNCANFASVTFSTDTEGLTIAGGVMGLGLSGTVCNCYNTGAATAAGSNSVAGGICGLNMDIWGTDDPYIQNCYNTGSVTATTTAAGIAASVNAIDSCYYLIGTADYAYYDMDDTPIEGAIMSATEMQSDAFCQGLNGWVTDNPVSSGLTESTMGLTGTEFQGWIQRADVNNSYPVFEDDSRLSETSNDDGNNPTSSYAPPVRTITVREVSSEVFEGIDESLFSAKASMYNAFSYSVEVKITDSDEADSSTFQLAGADGEVYPFDISVYIKGTTAKVQPAEGYSVTITLPLPETLWDIRDSISIVYINDDGKLTTLASTLKEVDGVWCFVFEANHFSPYALLVSDTWENPYGDVDEGDWFYSTVKYVAMTGLMNGTDGDMFSPGIDTSRAMIAVILWRMEGEPSPVSSNPFSDVAAGQWYTDAVVWAYGNGIVTGYDKDTFGPNDGITREQLATLLYRYAKYKGNNVSVGEDTGILSYEDALSISEYAIPAIQWACGSGLMEGCDSKLDPQGGATRAQLATILMRFVENDA